MPRANSGTSRASTGRERRQHPRAEAEWPVELLLADGPCKARLRDVSRSGVCFFVDRPIGMMTLLQLELELPAAPGAKAHTVKGAGAVVRCERISPGVEHYEVAVFLHDVSESDRDALDAHVRRLAARA
jgi:hypothetical protein